MPWKETVNPEENRLFNSSIGNWTGAMVWEPGPYYGYSGMAKITRNGATDPDSMSLSFPYLFGLASHDALVGFRVGWFTGSETFYSKWLLSDGVYSFDGEMFVSYAERWWSQGGQNALPAGWNKNQTVLKISIRPFSTYPIIAVFDFFSLSYKYQSLQHLPLCGIG